MDISTKLVTNEPGEYRGRVFKVATVIIIYLMSHFKLWYESKNRIFVLENQVEAKSKKSSLSKVINNVMRPFGEKIEKVQIEKPGIYDKFEYEIRLLKDLVSVEHFDVSTLTQDDIRELVHARNNLLLWTDVISMSIAFLQFIGLWIARGVVWGAGIIAGIEQVFDVRFNWEIVWELVEHFENIIRNGLYEIIPHDEIAHSIHKDKIGIITENGKVIIRHPIDERKTIDLGDYCPICFVEWVKNPESTPKKPDSNICFATKKCRHAFHCSCLQEWSSHQRVCPLCRKELFDGVMIVPFP
jgi:hypothetical protein